MSRKFHNPPLKTTNWVIMGIAERLTRLSETEIMAAVNDPANGISSKTSVIGQQDYFLINRGELLDHFAKSANCEPAPAA